MSAALARRQDRILIRVLAQLGPELLEVSRASDACRPQAAIPHLRAARRAIDAALAALAALAK